MQNEYVPALCFKEFTSLYDPVVRFAENAYCRNIIELRAFFYTLYFWIWRGFR